ncbi:putative ATP-dependent RNA helicase TDRD12 [Anopheles ziemanni]|uniref:putative ATP-dependent RNA helicase TDRD12 n=1 Tax=Anopheles ziemanni TaxID=345580 RepID=UPI00265F872F|nr:putative ATP-dependent RNA helicase TDRD12 [Anopheles ziemanni]
MEDLNIITITHFVNPHQFWFRDGTTDRGKQFLSELNKYCMAMYATSGPQEFYEYEYDAGEIVAVYDSALKNWTRNLVVGMKALEHQKRTYQLWSLDEGMPKMAAAKDMRSLPAKFTKEPSVGVKRGVLQDVLPVNEILLPTESRRCQIVSASWDNSINSALQTLIAGAKQTCFENVTCRKTNGEEIYYGDLRIISGQNSVLAKDFIKNRWPGLVVIVDQWQAQLQDNDAPNKPSIIKSSREDVRKRNPKVPVNIGLQDEGDLTIMNNASIMVNTSFDYKRNSDSSNTGTSSANVTIDSMTSSSDTPSATAEQQEISIVVNPYAILSKTMAPVPAPMPDVSAMNALLSQKQLVDTDNAKKKSTFQKKLERRNRLKSKLENQPDVQKPAAIVVPSATESNESKLPTVEEMPHSSPADKDASEEKDTESPALTTELTSGDIKRFDKMLNKETCVVSQLRYQRILVHGSNLPNPVDTIAKVHFSDAVFHALQQLGIRMVYRLQAHTWPHIIRGNSVVCVNSPGSGKTFGILPAICTKVMVSAFEQQRRKGAGPVGVIICHSSKEVERVGKLCRKMLNTVADAKMVVIEFYGIRRLQQVCNKLLNSCALLVTTAPGFRRIHESSLESLSRKRIQIVAIDNIERMQKHFSNELQLLRKYCDKPDLQMIVTASYWYSALSAYTHRYKNSIVCIGAYLEAAFYARVHFKLLVRRNGTDKQHALVRHIQEHDYRTQRTIVFASTAEDLAAIVETLQEHCINHEVCGDGADISKNDGFRFWDHHAHGNISVLICLDELIGLLDVSHVQHILHYSLPSSWTSFTRRFATSFSYYETHTPKTADDIAGKSGTTKPSAKPSTLVLLDETNNSQLPKFIDFLQLHNIAFSQELADLAQTIRSRSEHMQVLNGRPIVTLCSKLLTLAGCRNSQLCVYRHTLMKDDLITGGLPTSGTIRMKILHVISPAHFAVRLEAHQVESAKGGGGGDGGWVPLTDASQKFLAQDMLMQLHFSNAQLHQLYGKAIQRSDLCALAYENNYVRCRIIHFEPEGDSTTDGEVELRLIDTGRIVHTNTCNLLSLPEQFHALPEQAIDVRIAGVVPHDFEEEWDEYSTQYVQRMLDEHVKDQPTNRYIEGKVLLTLRDMIWIEELMLVEALDAVKSQVVSAKVKSAIVSNQFGVKDSSLFERIEQLVVKAVEDSRCSVARSSEDDDAERERSDSISSTSSFEVLSPTKDPGRYGFETLQKGFQYYVTIGRYFAPDFFYVYQLEKMAIIEQKINAYTAKNRRLKPLTQYAVGVYCFVRHEGRYRRCKIMQVPETAPVIVFLLDFGGTIDCDRESLFMIPSHLVRDLPFAAIEASFGYILPPEGSSWTEDAGYAVFDDVLEKYNENPAGLIAHVWGKAGSSRAELPVDGCNRYELLLANPDEPDPQSIVSELIQLKLAMFDGGRYERDRELESDDESMDESFVQVNFTYDEVKAILSNLTSGKSVAPGKSSTSSIVEVPVSDQQGSGRSRSRPVAISTDTNNTKTNTTTATVEPKPSEIVGPLITRQRSPHTRWRQDARLITLFVSAPDVSNYDLFVNNHSVRLQFERNGLAYLLSFRLFGPILPEATEHEIRGLSIMIRLAKFPGANWWWPHLTNHTDKMPWLKLASASHSDAESSDETSPVNNWDNLLPCRLDGDYNSSSTEAEDDDMGLLQYPTEEDIFYRS